MKNQYTYAFERLEVWQLARVLVKDIYKLTAKFPQEEKFGLTLQLRRASVSVSSNLAEGTSRFSKKDQAYKVELSFGSLTEIINQLILSTDLEFMGLNDLQLFRVQIAELSNKLNAFHLSLLRRIPESSKAKLNEKPDSGSKLNTNQQINKSTHQL